MRPIYPPITREGLGIPNRKFDYTMHRHFSSIAFIPTISPTVLAIRVKPYQYVVVVFLNILKVKHLFYWPQSPKYKYVFTRDLSFSHSISFMR